MIERRPSGQPPATTLVDILDRVLDKGLVVAGDIRVSLANVELLTIQIRLLVCSIDKAQEIGLDWWRRDGFLSSTASESSEATMALQARVEALEQQLNAPLNAPAQTTENTPANVTENATDETQAQPARRRARKAQSDSGRIP